MDVRRRLRRSYSHHGLYEARGSVAVRRRRPRRRTRRAGVDVRTQPTEIVLELGAPQRAQLQIVGVHHDVMFLFDPNRRTTTTTTTTIDNRTTTRSASPSLSLTVLIQSLGTRTSRVYLSMSTRLHHGTARLDVMGALAVLACASSTRSIFWVLTLARVRAETRRVIFFDFFYTKIKTQISAGRLMMTSNFFMTAASNNILVRP